MRPPAPPNDKLVGRFNFFPAQAIKCSVVAVLCCMAVTKALTASRLIKHHADAAGAINAKNPIVFQARNDECTVWRPRVPVGLVNPLAAEFRDPILRYARDAAAIVRRPDALAVGSNALGPGEAAAEDGKVSGTQREIL